MRPLGRLLAPRRVAVIAGRYAGPAIAQLRRIGFAGTIHPVSPSRAEIAGIAAVPSVAALPDGIDAAFLAVPAPACPAIVAELRAKDCGGAVCFSSEFAETGAAALQQALVAAASDMPLLGPNCHGILNGLDRVALWPDEHGVQPIERGVAILSQSGNIAINLTMQQRSVPIALVASLGNQAQLGAAPLLAHLARDERITAIGLHLEGLDDPPAFAAAAGAAHAAGKPIVVLKTGRSAAGARAAVTHTSTLAGSARVYDAYFERLGIAQVSSVATLLEALKLLHVHGRRPGRRICSASCSGGEAGLVADQAERLGLELPPLAPAHAQAVAAALDGRVRPDNPLDYQTFIWGQGDRLEAAFLALLANGFDTSLLIVDYPTQEGCDPSSWNIAVDAWSRAARRTGQAAAVVATLPECLPRDRRSLLLQEGIAPLQGIAEALEAVAAASISPPCGPSLHAMPDLAPGQPVLLGEVQAKAMLARYGLPVPLSRLVTRADCATAADELGYPVVVKTASPTVTHKSELGGVALGLVDATQVQDAVRSMAALGPDFLVERMVTDVVAEVIVGIVREPGFGPVLVLGAGGVLAELLDDSRILLLPVDRAMVEAALDRLRIGRLLAGYRAAAPGDRQALVAAILTLAEFAQAEAHRLVELDVNPILVRPEGQGVVVADALVRMMG
ncbi:acetate--CoA ligase family protein [Geminicoccus flavidas]|uniref:acetate--CoA ligase family protein n=1 Tax=Geminicoccus flavidas TaxID=2506407 RepID=UPI0013598BCD|nr:acetate--CoA ligase family protein [Geminicoccus flavidas]